MSELKLEDWKRAAIIRAIQAATNELSDRFPKDKKETDLNQKEKRVVDLLSSGVFGCNTDAVVNLMSELLERNLSAHVKHPGLAGQPVRPGKLAAVVPLSITNGHDYPLNEVAVVIDPSRNSGTDNKGRRGNSLPVNVNEFRPATPSEIADIPEAQLIAIAKEVVFIERMN